jgi:hypothetical protein
MNRQERRRMERNGKHLLDLEYYNWEYQGQEWEKLVNKKKDFDKLLKNWDGS